MEKIAETTNEILEVFEKQLRLKGLAKRTIKSYVQAIKDYLNFSQDFTLSDVAEYLNQKKIMVDNRVLSRSHYNQVQYAFDRFWIVFFNKRLPILKRIEVPVMPPKVINEGDVFKAMMKLTKRQDKIILGLAYFSMMRRAEIWTLDIYKDIDLRNNKVYIRAGKGWKPRITILAQTTKQHIQEEIAERKQEKNPNPWVCAKPGTTNRYLCYSELGAIIRNAGKAIGCDNWHPHLMRHSHSTHLDQNGVSTRKIQRLLGHSDIKTTQRYISHTQDQVLEVTSKVDEMLLQHSKKSSNNY
jgi:integrase/recombinase XerD